MSSNSPAGGQVEALTSPISCQPGPIAYQAGVEAFGGGECTASDFSLHAARPGRVAQAESVSRSSRMTAQSSAERWPQPWLMTAAYLMSHEIHLYYKYYPCSCFLESLSELLKYVRQ